MSETMNKNDDIRGAVAEAYAKAVSQPAPESCCGKPEQKGVAVKAAGYSSQELEALPSDAVVNSFGCGNPLAFSGVQAGETVVDLGAGAGIDLLIAAKKVGPTGRVIGIDMTDEMIAKANENIAASGFENVEVRKGFIEELPVEDASVDWVISNCVINLSPDKPKVFREIARVLKPGGQMSVSDIVVEDLPDWARQSAALYSSCVAGAISEAEYLQGLRDAGLEVDDVSERVVYDSSQLNALIESDLDAAEALSSCCGVPVNAETVKQLAGEFAGKVWSAKFHARKPARG